MRHLPNTRLLPLLVAALAVAATGCGDDADTSSTTTAPATTEATVPARSVEFRPVLSSAPCDETEGYDVPPGDDVLAAEGSVLCYHVAPLGADGVDISGATPVSDGAGGWALSITFAEHAQELANEMFNACFSGDESCPAMEGGVGYVAVVLDGVVLTAPAVQAEDLASGELQIKADLTEAEVTELATALDG